ncbi:MAG: hypothetical protein BGO57_01735 [Sphingomonadales bacterium 63-6]|nr:MAG: hypothetical protein BGO57_01735 [Sphingomonadales bacterium 63-6]
MSLADRNRLHRLHSRNAIHLHCHAILYPQVHCTSLQLDDIYKLKMKYQFNAALRIVDYGINLVIAFISEEDNT